MATIIQTRPTKKLQQFFPLFGLDADLLAVRLDLANRHCTPPASWNWIDDVWSVMQWPEHNCAMIMAWVSLNSDRAKVSRVRIMLGVQEVPPLIVHE